MKPADPLPVNESGADVWAPLTEAQEGLWYAQRLAPGNPSFSPAHCTTLRSPLDVPCFQRAVNQTLREAQSLSLRFRDSAEGPQQRLEAARCPMLELRDLRAHPPAEALRQAWDWIHDELARAVDPLRDPLSRQVLFLCAPAHSLWFQRVHHLAADGYGMALIEGRAVRLYQALRQGRPPEPSLEPLAPVWAEDQAWRISPARAKAQAFWRSQCAGHLPAASLAALTAPGDTTCIREEQAAPAALVRALQALETATGVSWPDILTTLGAAFVARHLGSSECVVGVPAMGRLGNASARAVTTIMNVMPWVCAPDETRPIAELLADAARALRTLRRHSRYQAEQLRHDMALPGGRARLHGPIINVLPFDAPYAAAGLDAAQTVLCTGPIDDLTLSLRAAPDGSGLRIELEANPRLYARDRIVALRQRLAVFLEQALHAARLADVSTLTPEEYERWEQDPNRTDHPVPDGTLWSRIRAQLQARAGQPALEDADGGALTGAQVEARTAGMVRSLRAAGAGPGTRVAVALPRGTRQVLWLLAILRSGAAYLPLDPQQPPARLRQILTEAQPCALVGPAELAEGLPTRWLDPATADEPPADDGRAEDAAPCAAGPEDPAYVIYTSGSTGTPKGVVVPHAAIVNRLEWMRAHYAVDARDRILYKTPATFDVSVWELFLPFLSGARLVVAPPDAHRDPAWLCRLILETGATIVHFVPSMLAAVLDEPAARSLQPRLVFCSGEALPAALRERFHATLAAPAQLHNLYGPTEATVDVSWWPADADDRSQPVPIGWPVWNTRLHVLDARLRPVPAGTPGQLYLAGRQLATGYLNRPDLTAERFIAAPEGFPDGRLYATGDLATRREDGAVLYLGRLDHQVKLRGQRLELGEIEAVLGRHPDVSQVAVLAREDHPGQMQLAAYVVAQAGREDARALAAHAAALLPDYMVPGAWIFLPALPVTANGKLDRRALPAPAHARRATARAPLRTPMQQRVAEAFRTVLGMAGLPDPDEDFFALGGHSLLAARLALQLRACGKPSLGAVFQHPTVSGLAAHLDTVMDGSAARQPAGFGPIVTLREAPGRSALFCIHPAGGLSWCYATLARALSTPRSVHGLQADALALDGAPAAASLTALAAHYADRVQALQAAGPYHLAGWSVGGILAQEIAVTLRARGETVGTVALLDAYPCEIWHDQPEPTPEDLCKALLHIAGADPRALPPGSLDHDRVIAFLRRQNHPMGELSDAQLKAVFATVSHTNRLVRAHTQRHYGGPVLHFQATQEQRRVALDPHTWQPHVEGLSIISVPATHAGLPGAAAVARIAPVLDAALAAADAAGARPHVLSPAPLSLHKEAP